MLGQFASLLIFFGVVWRRGPGCGPLGSRTAALPPLMQMVGAWTVEHFLIATTMLVVGLFAVLSWESTFPDRRDVLVLGPLPVRAGTMFLAKVAAVASALGLTLAVAARPGGNRLAAGPGAIRFHARSSPGFRSAAPAGRMPRISPR